ncbi:hypothetical protein DFH09DRAFT_912274, partial [Mycena vulgaris]
TRTLPRREIYSALQADMQSMMTSIQTQEQLDNLRARLEEVRDKIYDPPVVTHKGRPLSQWLTGATEGRPRGGGARIPAVDRSGAGPGARRQNQCSICHQPGHNRSSCPESRD